MLAGCNVLKDSELGVKALHARSGQSPALKMPKKMQNSINRW
jgi:hypothetical protein